MSQERGEISRKIEVGSEDNKVQLKFRVACGDDWGSSWSFLIPPKTLGSRR